MVDNLISKTIVWENDKKKSFLYDGVSWGTIFFFFVVTSHIIFPWLIPCKHNLQVRLVTILEEYKLTRLQKEEEKKRFRVIYYVIVLGKVVR